MATNLELIKHNVPCILQSIDFKTFVYCGSISDDERTGHGVCLKSSFQSDVGLVSSSFKLSLFTVYKTDKVPEEWNKFIDSYKSKYLKEKETKKWLTG